MLVSVSLVILFVTSIVALPIRIDNTESYFCGSDTSSTSVAKRKFVGLLWGNVASVDSSLSQLLNELLLTPLFLLQVFFDNPLSLYEFINGIHFCLRSSCVIAPSTSFVDDRIISCAIELVKTVLYFTLTMEHANPLVP